MRYVKNPKIYQYSSTSKSTFAYGKNMRFGALEFQNLQKLLQNLQKLKVEGIYGHLFEGICVSLHKT